MYKFFLSVKFLTLFFYYIKNFQKNQGLKRLSVKLFLCEKLEQEMTWDLCILLHIKILSEVNNTSPKLGT